MWDSQGWSQKPPMRYEIHARSFGDQTTALLYAQDHLCVAVNGSSVTMQREADGHPCDEWQVFELVREGVA